MITDAVLISLITALVSIITAALAAYTAINVAKTHVEMKSAKEAIVVLEKNTNSIKDELVAVTKRASFAEGVRSAEGTALVGAAGPQGEPGPQGVQGEPGPKGKIFG